MFRGDHMDELYCLLYLQRSMMSSVTQSIKGTLDAWRMHLDDTPTEITISRSLYLRLEAEMRNASTYNRHIPKPGDVIKFYHDQGEVIIRDAMAGAKPSAPLSVLVIGPEHVGRVVKLRNGNTVMVTVFEKQLDDEDEHLVMCSNEEWYAVNGFKNPDRHSPEDIVEILGEPAKTKPADPKAVIVTEAEFDNAWDSACRERSKYGPAALIPMKDAVKARLGL